MCERVELWNRGECARSPHFCFRPTLPSLALAPMAALWARAKEAVGLADDVEEQLLEIWKDILRLPNISVPTQHAALTPSR